METLINTSFFSHVKNDDMANIREVYNDFVEGLFVFCMSDRSNMVMYFTLNYTRIEFVSMQKSKSKYKLEKK